MNVSFSHSLVNHTQLLNNKKHNNVNPQTSDKKSSKKITAKKIAVGYLGFVAVSSALMLAYVIGRNPAKAARFLRGNQNIQDKIYEKGMKLSEDLFNKIGDFKTKTEDIFALFGKDSITDCPQHLLPSNRVFYHGSLKTKNIYKNGFTPFASRQCKLASREVGAGVYMSPDIEVASFFTGGQGALIPVKLDSSAKIAIMNDDIHHKFWDKIFNFVMERMTPGELLFRIPRSERNAMYECMINKIFKKAGYDAVFLEKGVTSGGGILSNLNPDINEVIGKNQSQLVVFTPEKLEIQSRNFKERVSDLKLKAKAFVKHFKAAYKMGHASAKMAFEKKKS